jgi:hypothetical protein
VRRGEKGKEWVGMGAEWWEGVGDGRTEAMAFAMRVLPVPGGPNKSIPFGGDRMPRYKCGCAPHDPAAFARSRTQQCFVLRNRRLRGGPDRIRRAMWQLRGMHCMLHTRGQCRDRPAVAPTVGTGQRGGRGCRAVKGG